MRVVFERMMEKTVNNQRFMGMITKTYAKTARRFGVLSETAGGVKAGTRPDRCCRPGACPRKILLINPVLKLVNLDR